VNRRISIEVMTRQALEESIMINAHKSGEDSPSEREPEAARQSPPLAANP
jgi:hypothetical protein